MTDNSGTPAGWYPDGQGNERYWDGSAWTDQTRTPGGEGTTPSALPDEPTRLAARNIPAPEEPSASESPAQPEAPQYAPPPAEQPQQPGGQPEPGQYGGAPPPAGPPGQYGQFSQPGGYGLPPESGSAKKGKGLLIGLIAGGVAVLLAVGALLFFVLRDGGPGDDILRGGGPGDTVEDFLDAGFDRNCDVIDFYSDDLLPAEEREEELAECEEDPDAWFGEDDLDGCEYDVTDEEIDGTEATVTVEFTGCEDEDNNEVATVELEEQGDDWKVTGFGEPDDPDDGSTPDDGATTE